MSASNLRPRAGKWPTRRLSLAPAGYCIHCWAMGGPPVAGRPFIWGYPSTKPVAERNTHYYCEQSVQEYRETNIELIPAQYPALTLVRGGKEIGEHA